jgi:hypothetical protein
MKHILLQYIDLVREKEEIQQRINKLQGKLEKINKEGNARDAVKGGEGGWKTFHIDGFPVADEDETKYLLNKNIRLLRQRENEIDEKVLLVEEYLNTLDDSRMRRMLTKRYIEGKKWYQVANEMGKRYTEDSCQKQMERFLKNL